MQAAIGLMPPWPGPSVPSGRRREHDAGVRATRRYLCRRFRWMLRTQAPYVLRPSHS